MQKRVLHILPNAHLDPVWLWDWREGLNEGIATCRSILDLMDEFPDMTFMRGEASVYEQIAKYDPATLERIRAMHRAGRWDIVGGNYVQSDTNVPDTTTFLRQYQTGKSYFERHFDCDVTAAWAADSFGHSAGLPDIYQACGLRYFAFCRPAENLLHLEKPLFYWQGAGGARILSWRCPVGWYGSERGEVPTRLNGVLNSPDYGLTHHAVFLGLGNHGGGTSRQQILDVLAWRAAHPEVEVRFSTLHGFFAASEAEVRQHGAGFLPTFEGELNFCLRGCHSSAAKIKWRFRRAEAQLKSATFAGAMLAPLIGEQPPPLKTAWNGLLFNTFHDILPGSSILRANQEQCEWLDSVIHAGRGAGFEALNRLNCLIDVKVAPVGPNQPQAVPLLVFNPRPTPWAGTVELEAGLDYRPRFDYENRPDEVPFEVLDSADRPVPFQTIATEMECFPHLPWRKRVVTHVELPPGGWQLMKIAFQPEPKRCAFSGAAATAPDDHTIANAHYRVSARRGGRSLHITRADGTPVLAREGLEFAVFEDLYGAWGSMDEQREGYTCAHRLETWQVREVKVLEDGPIRAALFIQFAGARSQVALTVRLAADRDAVEISGRLLWQDRGARLRLVADRAEAVTYSVPGGTIRRQVEGDVPTGRWLVVEQDGVKTALASDVLTGCTALDSLFALNLVRGNRAASDVPATGAEFPERPISDQGEHCFQVAISARAEQAQELADALELPPVTLMSWPHAGRLASDGTTLEIVPATVKLLDLQTPEPGRAVAWLQAPADCRGTIRFGGQPVQEFELAAWRIATVEFKF